MSESTLKQLKILVERAVRPVRASLSRKRKMREELLAHVASVFDEEVALDANEQAALERTARRFGNPAALAGQFQESIPSLDTISHLTDWVIFQPDESTLRRAVRYAIMVEVAALLLIFAMLLFLLRGRLGEWPTDTLWQIYPVLLISGYLGFTIGILESSLRRSLGERKWSFRLQFALVLLGSAAISMTLGILAYEVSPTQAIWLFFFTVGFPLGLAWRLAHHFTAQNRYHEDWASLQID